MTFNIINCLNNVIKNMDPTFKELKIIKFDIFSKPTIVKLGNLIIATQLPVTNSVVDFVQ